MKKRTTTKQEFERELQQAVIEGKTWPNDMGCAFRGAAASGLLGRLHEKDEDVSQIASDWNMMLRPFPVKYRVLGVPVFLGRKRPVVIAEAASG